MSENNVLDVICGSILKKVSKKFFIKDKKMMNKTQKRLYYYLLVCQYLNLKADFEDKNAIDITNRIYMHSGKTRDLLSFREGRILDFIEKTEIESKNKLLS